MQDNNAGQIPAFDVQQRPQPALRRSWAQVVKTLTVFILGGAMSGMITHTTSVLIAALVFDAGPIRRRDLVCIQLADFFRGTFLANNILAIVIGSFVWGGILGLITAGMTLRWNWPRGLLGTTILWEMLPVGAIIVVAAIDASEIGLYGQEPVWRKPFVMTAWILGGACYGFLLAVFARGLHRLLPSCGRLPMQVK
jgi:hypothetical protein